ncbi:MAG: 50S ribosomal protein L25/general stress protein Ctc [Rickettsiaceae bacterium]|nr:50S ribosomal protein L25/general stress protein Ctc [Rickettsiaceae bacterium]
MTLTILKCNLRENTGTGRSRDLRRNGMIPAVIYGKGKDTLLISLEEKEVTKLYRKKNFKSTILELDINGKIYKVMPKAVELHPTSELVRHVDFVFLAESGHHKVEVPIIFEGKDRSLGVKRGGFFNVIHRKVQLICPVDSIPANIEHDVTRMQIGSSLRSNSLNLPQGCSLVSKTNFVLASVTGRGGKSSDDSGEGASSEATPKGK